MKLRRMALGSERISSVTSSWRSPDLPVEAVRDDLVEHGQRDVDGDAVGVATRLELVGEGSRSPSVCQVSG